MPRRHRWYATGHQRSSNRRLPPATRRRILRQYPACWLALPGICVGKSTQVHHIVEHVDGGTDEDGNLVGVCEPCHTRHSAQQSQKRAVDATWDWKRKPEKHPGVLD